jgi:environmental stress-induced protein Ves
MKITRRGAHEFEKQSWKNGGGTTTELARDGVGDAFAWRVSVAEIERSGPFSEFPGYERTIMLLEGSGMELTVDGRAVRLDRPLQPFVFDGAAKTTCRLLSGPSRDLNVIADRGRARARVDLVERQANIITPCALIYAPGGGLMRIDDGEGEKIEIEARAVLIQFSAP